MKKKNSSQPGTLTFEKVLEVFKDYLQQDTVYEVVLTSHGYTLMAWNDAREEWYSADLMKTPKKLMNALLEAYAEFQEDRLTGSDRDLTPDEQAEINAKCDALRERCQNS